MTENCSSCSVDETKSDFWPLSSCVISQTAAVWTGGDQDDSTPPPPCSWLWRSTKRWKCPGGCDLLCCPLTLCSVLLSASELLWHSVTPQTSADTSSCRPCLCYNTVQKRAGTVCQRSPLECGFWRTSTWISSVNWQYTTNAVYLIQIVLCPRHRSP